VDANKDELFHFLFAILVQSQNKGKELVVTDDEAVIGVPRQKDEFSGSMQS